MYLFFFFFAVIIYNFTKGAQYKWRKKTKSMLPIGKWIVHINQSECTLSLRYVINYIHLVKRLVYAVEKLLPYILISLDLHVSFTMQKLKRH